MAQKFPRPPRHLKPATRRWWRSVNEHWILEEHHLRLLTLAGEAWDRAGEARELLERDGLTVMSRLGEIRAHPAVAVERDSRTAFARLLRELALDVDAPAENRPPRIGGGHAT